MPYKHFFRALPEMYWKAEFFLNYSSREDGRNI